MATTKEKLYKVTKVKVRKPTQDVICPHCSKKVAARGLPMHIKLAHGISKITESQLLRGGTPTSQKLKNGGFTQNDMGVKVKNKKTGEIGIIVHVYPNGEVNYLPIEELRSLYEKHCK